MSGDHNQYQKTKSYLNDDFECPRCGHCCYVDADDTSQDEDGWCDWEYHSPMEISLLSCDCGLIHEVDLRMVRYEYEDSEVYEVVDDRNLEVQMRLRRRDDLSPQRKWQGLTDEEIVSATNTVHGFGVIKQRDMNFAKAVEQALKEKNHG